MPNHFHAIITIGKNNYNTGTGTSIITGNLNEINHCRDAMLGVSNVTTHGTGAKHRVSMFGPQSKNLTSILRGFKSSVTLNARKINPQFAWQTLFYDRIVRDFDEYHRIEQYIQNNPGNWKEDGFYNK